MTIQLSSTRSASTRGFIRLNAATTVQGGGELARPPRPNTWNIVDDGRGSQYEPEQEAAQRGRPKAKAGPRGRAHMTIKRSRTRTISITSNIASNIAIGVTRIDNIITLKFRICGTYDTSSEAKVGRQRARRTFPRQPGNRSPAKTRHNAGSTSNMYRYCDSVLDALVASSASQPQFRSAPNRSSRIKKTTNRR